MSEITTLLTCLHPLLDTSTYRQLQIITQTLLMMTGRITMLSMSRWAGKGGSYRTIQRFFTKKIPWDSLNWAIAKSLLKQHSGTILIAGDATTVTKSGKKTYGLGRFFSSIYSRAVPGIAFQTLSLLDVENRSSWPMLIEQILPKQKQKKSIAPKVKTQKRGRGRPKGSKNKNHRNVALNAEMTQVLAMLQKLLKLTGNTLQLVYFVYDGAFGNNAAVQMTRQVGLHLISKLRNNSALYFAWNGVYSGKGRRPLYGDKVDFCNLPLAHLKSEETKNHIRTRIYHLNVMHKKFADSLNVVIINKKNTKTGKVARVILFSSDLDLEWEKIIDYYRLRFQIEFNFRDAKQHWGLEDFMVIKEQSVFNAAYLSLWMVNVSQAIMMTSNEESILDLKARHHGIRYAQEVLKILPKNTKPINIVQLFGKIPVLGRIHVQKMAA
ncbi:MAG: transposase [Desulfobacula sp.]|jgi:putative transposase|uniref:transposase n=1 Tax=Desulfobacula sp. TaxID=2593537 RepID=UPI0029FF696D|nr:transposase [Desulfobacula sp.]MBT7484589.1 transposase [Candidatus Peregrinibacteria bacterium]